MLKVDINLGFIYETEEDFIKFQSGVFEAQYESSARIPTR